MLHQISLRFEVLAPLIRHHLNPLNFCTGDIFRKYLWCGKIYRQFLKNHKWDEGENSQSAL